MFGGQGTAGGSGFSFSTPAASTTPSTGFSFGANTAGTGTTANTGFSFGGTTTTANPAPAGAGGFSFGGNTTAPVTGGFTGFGGLGAASTAATTTPAAGGISGFSFGAASSTAPGTTGVAAPTPAGFGALTGIASTASTKPASTTGFSLGGSMPGFGGLGANTSANALTTTVTTTAGISFGNTGVKTTQPTLSGLLGASTQAPSLLTSTAISTAPPGFSLGGTTAPAPAAAATGFSFGASVGSTPGTTTSTAPTSLGAGLSLGSGFTAKTTGTIGAATSTATAAAIGLTGGQKQMTFRQLEDTINKWTTELEEQEKCFLEQATQVNAWDRIVMENGEKIIQLDKDLERVKMDQQKLDLELDFVHSQQKELEELLTPLETALDQLPPISHTQHAQLEREHTYTLAESLDSQLKRMSQDMKEIVERLNSTNVKADDNDPLQQITKILNSHVVSLMWVNRNSTNLQRRAEEIAKMMDLEKREQERNFRMAYS